MSDHQILETIERGGHRLGMDAKGDSIRVICNGAVQAQFSAAALGEVEALECAILHLKGTEAKCLKYPKTTA